MFVGLIIFCIMIMVSNKAIVPRFSIVLGSIVILFQYCIWNYFTTRCHIKITSFVLHYLSFFNTFSAPFLFLIVHVSTMCSHILISFLFALMESNYSVYSIKLENLAWCIFYTHLSFYNKSFMNDSHTN